MTVVSFKYNFVFIKTTKTAGTSIEVELSRRVEDAAIVTPVTPPEAGHVPRNYKRGLFKNSFTNHMPARLVRRYIGEARFRDLYAFCVEREPVSKCISHFHMLKNSDLHRSNSDSWEDYVCAGNFPIDLDKYSEVESGARHLIVDEVIPYELLRERLPQLMERQGIDNFRLEASAKAEYSRRKFVSSADVTDAQRSRIYEAFRESLETTGLHNHYALVRAA